MTMFRNRTEKKRAHIAAMIDVELTIFIADEQERAATLIQASKTGSLTLRARRELDQVIDRVAFAQKCWLER